MTKPKPKRTAFQVIWSIFTTLIVIAAVLFAVLMVGVRLAGLEPFAVISPSMEPAYHVGSLVYVQKCKPEEVKIGDPITFVANESLLVVTHRVVGIDSEHGFFTTKGDANATEDGAPVAFGNLIGRPVFTVPYLGYVSQYISKPPGTYVAIGVGAVLLLMFFVPDFFKKKEKKSGEEPQDQNE